MSSKISVLSSVPLFTVGNPVPVKLSLRDLFRNWPAENKQFLNDAQRMRDNLVESAKPGVSPEARINAIDQYLPYALEIENEIVSNPNGLRISDSARIHWRQSPIVNSKCAEKSFTAREFSCEIVHLVWMKSVLMLNKAYVLNENHALAESIATLKEVAGIHHFLASDRARCNANTKSEFQPGLFNSMKSLCLGEVYSLIASKGEADGLQSLALAKLCYTISATFSSSLDALNSVTPIDLIHPQYTNMLRGLKQFYYAASAINYAYYQHGKDACGKAISLIRFAIDQLTSLVALDRENIRINEAANNLLSQIKPLDEEWSRNNFYVQNDYIPTKEEAELMITQSVTSMPNLPQPTPFSLPEAARNITVQPASVATAPTTQESQDAAAVSSWSGAQYGQSASNDSPNSWNGSAQYGQNNTNSPNSWNGSAQYGQNNASTTDTSGGPRGYGRNRF